MKKVVILKDEYSPLWYVRCAEPCMPDGWCQGRKTPWNEDTPKPRWVCWLGSAMTRDGAEKLVRRGYGEWELVK